MRLKSLYITLLLILSIQLPAQSVQDACVTDVRDFTFTELMNEGLNTMARQLDILHVPVRQFKFVIKGHIRRHHFALNKGKNSVKKTTFRAISFTYTSISPQGDPVTLSGLVTIPILPDNKPSRMLVYHRIMAPSYTITPSRYIPIEAVLTADNTICVFPDYYGCGVTEGKPHPYIALNYHARCATDCVLAALDIVQDAGIALSDDFYTWNTGYSQGGGYAMAMHKYIETVLPDSLAQRINLRWSLCGDGVYKPINLYETAISRSNMGSTPTVYLQGLRSLFYAHSDRLGDLQLRDFLSDKAIETGIDSILLVNDDSLWDLVYRLDNRVESADPNYYFNPMVLDTNTSLFKTMAAAFDLDDCVEGWTPQSPVIMLHSKNDNCIPYQHAVMTYRKLEGKGGSVKLVNPSINKAHVPTSIIYFSKLLRIREDKLYQKLAGR
jgi:hypothetical protein